MADGRVRDAAAPRLRVLMVGLEESSFQPGGLNRYAEDLLDALSGLDAPALLLVIGAQSRRTSSGQVVVRATRNRPLRLLRIWWAAQRLSREVDVLDLHFALPGLLLVHFGRLRRKPLVVHFHGPWAAESAAQGQRRWVVAAKRVVERSVYRKADRFVVLSNSFKKVLVESYRVPPWKIEVIAPGVDLAYYTPGDGQAMRQLLGLGDKRVVVTVRRLVPRMGHRILLRAWSEVVRRHDDTLRLLVAGEGPLRSELEQEVDRLGIRGCVRFLGTVQQESLRGLYRTAEVSVVPSVALEGFGLVVLESLATGTPVIASRIGGLPDALQGLDPGLLVPPGDPESLADAIDNHLRGGLGPDATACRQHAERFSWSTAADAHVGLYRQVVEPPAARARRVVYLDHTAQLSGGELALARLLPALRSGVEAHVILAEDGPLTGRLEAAGVSVEVLPMDPALRQLRRDRIRPGGVPLGEAWAAVRYSVRLAARLRALRPDLVHTNSLKAMLYGLASGRLARTPVVVQVHDRISPDYLPTAAVRLVRLLCRRVADGVVANSTATLATLPRECHAVVISSPVEVARFSPVRVPDSAHRFTVAALGRITPWKGQDLFLRAFAAAFPDGEETALIVGSALFGEDAFDAEIRALAVDLGVGDRVEFCGFCEDVADVLSGVDVLVHTSVIPEPFGQVVVEGMAAGRCVIASGEGGPATIVTDGFDGILCQPRSVSSFASALRRVRDDPDLRARLGANARKTADRFAPEVVGQDLLPFYDTVARPTPSGGEQ